MNALVSYTLYEPSKFFTNCRGICIINCCWKLVLRLELLAVNKYYFSQTYFVEWLKNILRIELRDHKWLHFYLKVQSSIFHFNTISITIEMDLGNHFCFYFFISLRNVLLSSILYICVWNVLHEHNQYYHIYF